MRRRRSAPSCWCLRSKEAEMTPPEPWELSAEEVARRVVARELTAGEVLEAALRRTAQVEPLIHAYLEIFEPEARARAAEIDRRVAAGKNPGPLAGVPVTLKDNLSLCG